MFALNDLLGRSEAKRVGDRIPFATLFLIILITLASSGHGVINMNPSFSLDVQPNALSLPESAHSELASNASSRAKALLESHPELPYSSITILVRFASDVSEEARINARAIAGTRLVRRYTLVPGLELLETYIGVEPSLSRLNGYPGVLYAEPDHILKTSAYPDDPMFEFQWGLHNVGQTVNDDPGTNGSDIDAVEAWDLETGDPEFVIAVIDTGMQLDHPDIIANTWTNPNEIPGNGYDDDGNGYVDDIHGWDFYGNDNDPTDDTIGHGLYVAGIIGAVGNNSQGITGVNWRCKILPLRFLGPEGGFTSDAILAFQYCTQMGVKLSNNSWGGSVYAASLYDAMNNARSYGHLFVCAAGNNGRDIDTLPFYPASHDLDNIISVAATDNDDQLPPFSNYGLVSVDLGAPGVNIYSTFLDGSYRFANGTSAAAPHVTGVASLIWGRMPNAPYYEIRQRIFDSVRQVPSLSGTTATGGVVNAFAALQGTNSRPQISITSPQHGSQFREGNTIHFSGYAFDAEDGDLSQQIVWHSDIQGNIGTGSSFFRNDLNPGVHLITASVTDSAGAQSSTSVTIVVTPNSPPAVVIVSPTNTSYSEGDVIQFIGSAHDPENGDLSDSLVWHSSLQGQIGTGPSFSRSDLVVGTHIITATATDNDGLQGSDTVTIEVYQPQGPQGDVNGDGCVDDTDLLLILFAFGNYGGAEDLDGNGVVDDGDLLIVLFHFGDGC